MAKCESGGCGAPSIFRGEPVGKFLQELEDKRRQQRGANLAGFGIDQEISPTVFPSVPMVTVFEARSTHEISSTKRPSLRNITPQKA